jgi:hypothetical protein
MIAVDSETEEVFMVETDLGEYGTACELERIVGIDLEDG